MADDLAGDAPSLVDRIDAQDVLARVQRAIPNLPEGERSALLMKISGELDYDDIAVALGISVVAAKVRVHRARQRLAGALAHPTSKRQGETQ